MKESKASNLNVVIPVITKRKNNSLRIQQDFRNCPSMCEQHTSHLTDINYLMKKFKPDELAAYIQAKNERRAEITGHDFSQEPDLQEAKNRVYQLKSAFEALDPKVKMNFKNHVEFCKFIDNPKNQQMMLDLGLMTKREIAANTTDTGITTTEEEAAPSQSKNAQSSPPKP